MLIIINLVNMIDALDLYQDSYDYGHTTVREVINSKEPHFGFVRGILKIKDLQSCHFPPKPDGDFEFKLYDVVDESKVINVYLNTCNMVSWLYYKISTGRIYNKSCNQCSRFHSHNRKRNHEYICSSCNKRIREYSHLTSTEEFDVVVFMNYDGSDCAEYLHVYPYKYFDNNYINGPPDQVFDTLDKYNLDYKMYDHDCVTFSTPEHDTDNAIQIMSGYLIQGEWGGDDDEDYGEYLYGVQNIDLYQFKDAVSEVTNDKQKKLRYQWRYNQTDICDMYYAYIESEIREDSKYESLYDQEMIPVILLVSSDNFIEVACFDVEKFKDEF